MSSTLRFATARDLFEACPAARADMSAAPTDDPTGPFLDALRRSRTPEDAVTFCAYLLDERTAVWWAHECVRSTAGDLADDDAALLALARSWVHDPGEEPRRLALLGATGRARSPAAWIALAAGWSFYESADSGRTLPLVGLTPRAVNAGVLAALARVPRADRHATLALFVDMAVHLSVSENSR